MFTGHKSSIHSLAFSSDGKLLAAGGEDRKIRIWDIGSSTQIKELKGHSDIVHALSWHKNSRMLASAGMDGTIKLWDIHRSSQADGGDPNLQNGEIQPPGQQNLSPQSSNWSPELMQSYPSACSGIIDLSYSFHNTLVAVGLAGSSGSGPATSKCATNGISSVPVAPTLLQAALTSSHPSNVVKIVMNGGTTTVPSLF